MSDDRKNNPSAHFDSPQQVVEAADLSNSDKLEVLTNWANEIRQLQVAEEENMKGGTNLAARLEAVEQALLALGDDDAAHDAKA